MMMRKASKPVLGVVAPPARPTLLGAALLAALVAIPAGVIGQLIEWALF